MSSNCLFVRSGYVSHPLANGIGRFIPQCQRITLKFCKEHGGSRGARDFIEHDLVDVARKYPFVVLYAKPRRHRSSIIVAEYLNGHREWFSIHNFERDEIRKWMKFFIMHGGQGSDFRFKQMNRTDHPSIQGVWTSLTHKDPEKNVAAFPNENYHDQPMRHKTASEILLEMYGQNKKSPPSPN